ncbi:MAG TPA: right-handed parallel beta-helix repeat-containing protein [Candidatus Acidoferrum sp.]|jgi:nitrous oxidase accessory protein NosD|nr:right-handed parallel beta-helix repeat-containing protein [Candidatus Acidoferrum sp.]
MKNKLVYPLALAAILVAAFVWPATALPTRSAQLVVDDDKVECPNAEFTHIQDAVDAASPGDEIHICKGIYVEQVAIRKSLKIDADNGAILMPSAMQANTTSLFDAAPIATALLVADATGVSISGMTVDGVNSGISQCAPDLIGITFQNASGELDRTAVRNFKLTASLNGCQSGTGIFVQSGNGGVSKVEIDHCTVHDFQKNGITADEIGTITIIRRNVVTGIGPTTGAAQNGVQIGFGAAGSILDNVVTNNVWSPCTTVSTCTAVATNILVTQSDGVEVSGNTAGISQVNVFVDGNDAGIERNETFASVVFDDIRLQGDQSRVRQNHVLNGAESGIFISGNSNVVTDNVITEAAIGILKATGSSGNIIRGNRFFNTPVQVQDPQFIDVAKLISPKR